MNYSFLIIILFHLVSCTTTEILRLPASSEDFKVEVYGHRWTGEDFSPIRGQLIEPSSNENPIISQLSYEYKVPVPRVQKELEEVSTAISWHREFDWSLSSLFNFEDKVTFGNYFKPAEFLSLSYKYNKSISEMLELYNDWMMQLFFINKEDNNINLIKDKLVKRLNNKIHPSLGIENTSELIPRYLELSLLFNKKPTEIIKDLQKINTPRGFVDSFGIHVKTLASYYHTKKPLNSIKSKLKTLKFNKENYLFNALSTDENIVKTSNEYFNIPYPWNIRASVFTRKSKHLAIFNMVMESLKSSKTYPVQGLHFHNNERPFMMGTNTWEDIHRIMAAIKISKIHIEHGIPLDSLMQAIHLFKNCMHPLKLIDLSIKSKTSFKIINSRKEDIFSEILTRFKKNGINVEKTIYGDHLIDNYRFNIYDVVEPLVSIEINSKIKASAIIESLFKESFHKIQMEDILDSIKNNAEAYNALYSHKSDLIYDKDVDFVFDIFKEQTKQRSVFTSEFIAALKVEEQKLSSNRLTHFAFKNNSNDIVGFFGIFDGRNIESDFTNRDNLLPLERKQIDIKIVERDINTPVIEIRRLAVAQDSGFEFETLLNFLADYLNDNYSPSTIVYAHTDSLGSRIFKSKAGFQVDSKSTDGKVVLKIELHKMVSHIKSKHFNCLNSLKSLIRSVD